MKTMTRGQKKKNSMIVSLTTSAISLSRTNGFTSKDSLVQLKACGILLCARQPPKQLEDYIKHPTTLLLVKNSTLYLQQNLPTTAHKHL
jgi:hypothetical protein